jgi:hypothetical protein
MLEQATRNTTMCLDHEKYVEIKMWDTNHFLRI